MAPTKPSHVPVAAKPPPLEIRRVPVASLQLDPDNARRHPERNLEAIKAALLRFGQRTPLVVDAAGIVRKGNGTLMAARELGWLDIDISPAPELEGAEAKAYALADNQSGDLSIFDQGLLEEQLAELEAMGIDRVGLGFDEVEEAEQIEIKEVETSKVLDRFWLSVTGPLPAQPEVLAELQKALEKIDGCRVSIGTTNGN